MYFGKSWAPFVFWMYFWNMATLEFIDGYREAFLARLKAGGPVKEPRNLYEPMAYILDLGGKRLRPVLTLMCCELFGGKAQRAMDAALAVETFHNFSLVHDDIMDRAPLRRGQATVHEKWDLNTGTMGLSSSNKAGNPLSPASLMDLTNGISPKKGISYCSDKR